MNDDQPPQKIEKPQLTPVTEKDADNSPSFVGMFFIGIFIAIFSIPLCIPFQSPAPFIFGFFLAFISLFGKGYRGIFLGFVTTIGLSLLCIVLWCASHPFMG
jgi:hypothetical protein